MQDVAGRLAELEADALLVAVHQLGQGFDIVAQSPVKRHLGNAFGHQPGEAESDGPQQKERGQHPVQNFAEQRTLAALKQLHHEGRDIKRVEE